jgi:ferric-dicitrate binding protein FerR (iron transport regulator)
VSSADCERWVALSDQAAVGQDLSGRDQAWLVQHARTCSDCGREAALYTSLRDAVGRPEMLVVPSPAARPRARRSPVRIAMLGAVALAASVAIVTGFARNRGDRALTPAAVQEPPLTARLLFASGNARLGAGPAQAGQVVTHGERFATGDGFACMAIASSITVCLDAMSAATVALADPKHTIVYLEKGRLLARLDHQPAGRTFLVRTAQAEVQAVGTRFSVGISDDGQTQVRLHEGKVTVRAANHVASDLAAPVQARVGDDIRVASMPATASQDDDLLSDLSTLPRTETRAIARIASIPAGADVSFDNVVMGKAPVSTVLAADAHVRLAMAGYVPVSEWISVADGAPIERSFVLTGLAAPVERPDRTARAHRGAPSESPSHLLAMAQALRARGAYDACAEVYSRLLSEFPGSEESKVSLISLGELELGKRNHPLAALEAFSAYLRTGGPLEREARFGRIRVLRAVGRDGEADAESATFMRDYPTSIQSATLRRQVHER